MSHYIRQLIRDHARLVRAYFGYYGGTCKDSSRYFPKDPWKDIRRKNRLYKKIERLEMRAWKFGLNKKTIPIQFQLRHIGSRVVDEIDLAESGYYKIPLRHNSTLDLLAGRMKYERWRNKDQF